MRIIIAFLLAVAPLAAQSSDWVSLKQVSSDAPISVLTHRRFSCNFQSVTETALLCRVRPSSVLFNRIQSFARQDIQEVRLEDRWLGKKRGALIGLVAGAALCVGVAAANRSAEAGGAAVYCGLLGAGIGWGVGHDFPVRGPVIYNRAATVL